LGIASLNIVIVETSGGDRMILQNTAAWAINNKTKPKALRCAFGFFMSAAVSQLLRHQPHRQIIKRMDGIVRTLHRRASHLNPVHTLSQGTQDRLTFRPRDILSNAGVNTNAKREMSRRIARDIEPFRIIPMGRVMVRRAKNAEDL